MRLPNWNTCQENIALGQATALERFIGDYEPHNVRDALIWRRDLEDAIMCARQMPEYPGMENARIDAEGQLLLANEGEPE